MVGPLLALTCPSRGPFPKVTHTASYSNGTWTAHSKYEEMPEQFTEEEWNKFCEEMGLENGN